MYIAGIEPHQILQRLPVSHNQGVESIAWISTFSGLVFSYTLGRKALKETKASGPADTSSLTPFQKALTPIHSLSLWIPAGVYVVATALNRMEQPNWFADWELPRGDLSVEWHAGLRTLACFVNAGSYYLLSRTFKHLGSQWHFIGVREKPRVVQSGPYSVVRHPMYTAFLVAEASYALMWWNSIPLVGLGITIAALAFKIPLEERLREQDPATGTEYTTYKAKVTYRLIPWIW